MIRGVGLTAAAVVVLALGACGKSTSNTATSEQPANPTEPASAPPTLTDAQKKALLAELPAAYQSADLDNGQAKFAICRSCHTNVQGGGDMVGPNLYGIFGRKSGSEAGFAYSDDLKNAGWTWDADHLDKWITNPRGVLANSKMTFVGVPDPKDRTDIIAYLKVSTSPAPKA
ncbi:MAG: c-type cytochrome [Caulobacterales bacterium]